MLAGNDATCQNQSGIVIRPMEKITMKQIYLISLLVLAGACSNPSAKSILNYLLYSNFWPIISKILL